MGVWAPGPAGTAGDDTFTGDATDEQASGLAGADVLNGNGGNDTLNGGAGADALNGGDGTDTASYAGASSGVTASLANPGSNTGDAAGDTYSSIEGLFGSGNNDTLTGDDNANSIDGSSGIDTVSGGGGDDLLDGGSGNDTMFGGDGNDRLDGDSGEDTMSGGLGNDVYLVDDNDDVVIENAGEGIDRVASAINYTLGANLEDLTLLGATNLSATGNTLNNVILGNDGANLIDGGAGADTMTGGKGDDIYVVDNVGDTVVESTSTLNGVDQVLASVSFTLSAGVENLQLTGTDSINGTGNTLANIITGNNGSNILDGGTGADTLQGGGGNDQYYVDNVGDVIVEANGAGTDIVWSSVNWALGAYVENLILTGSAVTGTGNGLNNSIYGNALANVLTGGVGNDALFGGDGNDTLDGGSGADAMTGNAGDDTYYVDSAGDTVSEGNPSGGTDIVYASVSFSLASTGYADHLILEGVSAINGSGNSLNNTITGNSAANVLQGSLGNDTLNAGAGADTLYGGDGADLLDGGTDADTMIGNLGDDTYFVDNAGDIVLEGNIAGGLDTVNSSVTFNLGPTGYADNLVLTGVANIDGFGNSLGNTMTGNSGANELWGNGGNDTLIAGDGADSLYGGDGADSLDGGAGADLMIGNLGNDTYYVDNVGDVVSEGSNTGGVDQVFASISFSLAPTGFTENLTLTGSGAINATGNGLANTITGNSGANSLTGGAGADTFVFSTPLGGSNIDAITDFVVADDTIQLSSGVFTAIGVGALSANAFVIGAAAADADDRIIYNSGTGQLFYDADGNGAGAQVLFATLSTGLALTSADFIVGGP